MVRIWNALPNRWGCSFYCDIQEVHAMLQEKTRGGTSEFPWQEHSGSNDHLLDCNMDPVILILGINKVEVRISSDLFESWKMLE